MKSISTINHVFIAELGKLIAVVTFYVGKSSRDVLSDTFHTIEIDPDENGCLRVLREEKGLDRIIFGVNCCCWF